MLPPELSEKTQKHIADQNRHLFETSLLIKQVLELLKLSTNLDWTEEISYTNFQVQSLYSVFCVGIHEGIKLERSKNVQTTKQIPG